MIDIDNLIAGLPPDKVDFIQDMMDVPKHNPANNMPISQVLNSVSRRMLPPLTIPHYGRMAIPVIYPIMGPHLQPEPAFKVIYKELCDIDEGDHEV